jgi:hypothetical protein
MDSWTRLVIVINSIKRRAWTIHLRKKMVERGFFMNRFIKAPSPRSAIQTHDARLAASTAALAALSGNIQESVYGREAPAAENAAQQIPLALRRLYAMKRSYYRKIQRHCHATSERAW